MARFPQFVLVFCLLISFAHPEHCKGLVGDGNWEYCEDLGELVDCDDFDQIVDVKKRNQKNLQKNQGSDYA